MKKAGLIGGISWVSTMDYYRLINEGINAKLGGLNFAECIIYSLNFGDIQEKTWKNAYELLLDAGTNVKKSGADAIVLCANTAHLFADRLQEELQLPLVHIGAETAKTVQRSGIKKIALLGTIFTMEMEFYRQKLMDHGLEVLTPHDQETRNYIQHTIKEELGRGVVNPVTKQHYISIVNDLVGQGAEGVILGCTEIPLLIGQTDFPVPVFDTTGIHVNAIVDFMLA
jgi:aspartate racemase